MNILETDRLILRPFSLADAPFIMELVNTPGWLAFIGDRNVHSVGDAENYLQNGPLKGYADTGLGYWTVSRKEDLSKPIGSCGLMKRDTLQDIDIGYALIPEFEGLGYATEAAQAVLSFAFETKKVPRVVAISTTDNVRSAKVLQKIGMKIEGTVRFSADDDELFVFGVEAPKYS
ncbi:MAG: GNAT family N-acetyltransferase [Sphingobacteriaceae bacterium]